MYALATCTTSILRGTTTNEFGDTVDAGTVIATGIPASIAETDHTTYDPATQTPRTVRHVMGFVQSNVDIRSGDQLRDDTYNITYMVVTATQPGGPGWTSDIELDLKRITNAL